MIYYNKILNLLNNKILNKNYNYYYKNNNINKFLSN